MIGEIGIHFNVIYRDNDLLEVRIAAWNGAFSGATDVYVHIGEPEDLGAKLAGFPRSNTDLREITLGTFGDQGAGGGFSMRFYCVDSSAHAFVASGIESGNKVGGVTQSTVLAVSIEAAAVDEFVYQFRNLASSGSGSAFLKGLPVIT